MSRFTRERKRKKGNIYMMMKKKKKGFQLMNANNCKAWYSPLFYWINAEIAEKRALKTLYIVFYFDKVMYSVHKVKWWNTALKTFLSATVEYQL